MYATLFSALDYSDILFLLPAAAAFMGLLWRFFYNEQYHAYAHSATGRHLKYIQAALIYSYICFVVLTVCFFMAMIVAGVSLFTQP
jgi:hypothetical protein